MKNCKYLGNGSNWRVKLIEIWDSRLQVELIGWTFWPQTVQSFWGHFGACTCNYSGRTIFKMLLLEQLWYVFNQNFHGPSMWQSKQRLLRGNFRFNLKKPKYIETSWSVENENLHVSWQWLIWEQNGVTFRTRRGGDTIGWYVGSWEMFLGRVYQNSLNQFYSVCNNVFEAVKILLRISFRAQMFLDLVMLIK